MNACGSVGLTSTPLSPLLSLCHLCLQQPASLLTFEGESFRGPQAIVQKFVGLPFKSIQHAVKSVDCAESAAGILVFVTGDLKVTRRKHWSRMERRAAATCSCDCKRMEWMS